MIRRALRRRERERREQAAMDAAEKRLNEYADALWRGQRV